MRLCFWIPSLALFFLVAPYTRGQGQAGEKLTALWRDATATATTTRNLQGDKLKAFLTDVSGKAAGTVQSFKDAATEMHHKARETLDSIEEAVVEGQRKLRQNHNWEVGSPRELFRGGGNAGGDGAPTRGPTVASQIVPIRKLFGNRPGGLEVEGEGGNGMDRPARLDRGSVPSPMRDGPLRIAAAESEPVRPLTPYDVDAEVLPLLSGQKVVVHPAPPPSTDLHPTTSTERLDAQPHSTLPLRTNDLTGPPRSPSASARIAAERDASPALAASEPDETLFSSALQRMLAATNDNGADLSRAARAAIQQEFRTFSARLAEATERGDAQMQQRQLEALQTMEAVSRISDGFKKLGRGLDELKMLRTKEQPGSPEKAGTEVEAVEAVEAAKTLLQKLEADGDAQIDMINQLVARGKQVMGEVDVVVKQDAHHDPEVERAGEALRRAWYSLEGKLKNKQFVAERRLRAARSEVEALQRLYPSGKGEPPKARKMQFRFRRAGLRNGTRHAWKGVKGWMRGWKQRLAGWRSRPERGEAQRAEPVPASQDGR